MARAFELGRIVVTAGVNERMEADVDFCLFVYASLLNRYYNGDWGILSDEDKKQNDLAVVEGNRIMGQYDSPGHPRIWIITEWDRSVTTILFPDEY